MGMSWSLLARLVGVSATAIRKWRHGTTLMTPENRSRLALVLAFCDVLGELDPRIVDPSLWFETPLTASTTLTPADLFVAGHTDVLLDLAAERTSPPSLLDLVHPEWRQDYPADVHFRVVEAPDGLPSIIPAT
jgi:transcriptional regulator with XRE-family HTH domain